MSDFDTFTREVQVMKPGKKRYSPTYDGMKSATKKPAKKKPKTKKKPTKRKGY